MLKSYQLKMVKFSILRQLRLFSSVWVNLSHQQQLKQRISQTKNNQKCYYGMKEVTLTVKKYVQL